MSCINYYKDYSLFLKLNHEITIPKGSKLVYRAENEGPLFMEMGIITQYLNIKRFTKEYLDNYKSGRNISIENAITNILDEIQVPQEKTNLQKSIIGIEKQLTVMTYIYYILWRQSLHIFEDFLALRYFK